MTYSLVPGDHSNLLIPFSRLPPPLLAAWPVTGQATPPPGQEVLGLLGGKRLCVKRAVRSHQCILAEARRIDMGLNLEDAELTETEYKVG